jgi:hypothetical protein
MRLFDIPSLKTTKSNEWYTPSKYIEAARQVMGSIDLVPASCELANRTVKAARYYTKEDNGLALPWYGNVWLNPPYTQVGGKSSIKPWIRKAIESEANQIILLVPNDASARWFEWLWSYIICLPPYRINFDIPGKKSKHPTFGTCFTYLGPHESRFIDIFSQFGTIAKRVSSPKQPSHIQSVLDLL